MSSHHVVRDEQEPALLLIDLSSVSSSIIHELLEWSPTVVVLADQVSQAIDLGFKIDVVICAEQDISDLVSRLTYQLPVKFLSYHDPDTAIDEALNHLIATKHKAVNLIAQFDTRIEDLFSSFSDRIQIVVYGNGFKWYKVGDAFTKWFASGQKLKIWHKSAKLIGDLVAKSDNCFETVKEGKVMIQTDLSFVWFGEKIN